MQPDPGTNRGVRPLTGPAEGQGRAKGQGLPDLGEPLTLHLVRHARTADTGRIPSGGDTAGPALNEAGVAESVTVAAGLAAGSTRTGVPDLLTSPVLRAAQTASVLGAALGTTPRPVDGWAELRLGEWDGLTYARIAAGWPQRYRQWRGSPSVAPPGGESVDDLRARVAAAVAGLVRTHAGRTVVVVTHTGPIRSAVADALGAGPEAFWRLRIDPAGISTLRFWADGGVEVVGVNRRLP